MSGSSGIDPRQAGRFDISHFHEPNGVYVCTWYRGTLWHSGSIVKTVTARRAAFSAGCTPRRRG